MTIDTLIITASVIGFLAFFFGMSVDEEMQKLDNTVKAEEAKRDVARKIELTAEDWINEVVDGNKSEKELVKALDHALRTNIDIKEMGA